MTATQKYRILKRALRATEIAEKCLSRAVRTDRPFTSKRYRINADRFYRLRRLANDIITDAAYDTLKRGLR